MKKKIFALAVVLICLSVLASATAAYFTDIATARNVITAGGISIEVVEQQYADGVLQPYPADPVPVMPAAVVSKIVSVRSLEQAAWIRAKYSVRIFGPDGEEMETDAELLNDLVMIEPDEENWMSADGWWYYKSPVKNGETTAPLFEEVAFSGPKMDNKYQRCTVKIEVNAQAVQQANNGAAVTEAEGWPED